MGVFELSPVALTVAVGIVVIASLWIKYTDSDSE